MTPLGVPHASRKRLQLLSAFKIVRPVALTALMLNCLNVYLW